MLVPHCAGVCISRQVPHRVPADTPLHSYLDAGYFVTAPDLLGHGSARRGSDYTIAALAEELRPFFSAPGGNDHPYHIVVGHSLGGIVASAILPLLKSIRPVPVVLVDPPFEQTPGSLAFHRKLFGDRVRYPKTPEAYHEENPLWTKEDATLCSLGARLCDVTAVEAILDVSLFVLLGGRCSRSSPSKMSPGRFHTCF